MKTAFIIFDRMTALDFIGVYDSLTRLKTMDFAPEFSWESVLSRQPSPMTGECDKI